MCIGVFYCFIIGCIVLFIVGKYVFICIIYKVLDNWCKYYKLFMVCWVFFLYKFVKGWCFVVSCYVIF